MIYQFRGRTVPGTLGDGLLKDWIHRCDTQHERCAPPSEHRKAFLKGSTIRLIDVEERRIVLDTRQEREYVALSYVWGASTQGSLTSHTFKRFSSPNGIPEDPDTIPQTILDTIRLVRDIGFRYLWIDSLCILQDDDRDKLRHFPHMDTIYSCASLVIIAAAGQDAHAGLPGVVRGRRAWQHNGNLDSVPFITAQPSLCEALERTMWNDRGWTFQEAMLAHRTIVFTDRLVYWNCHEDCWREDLACEVTLASIKKNYRTSLWASMLDRISCNTRIYCDHVMRFSRRHFKEDGDVLWAFVGVLKSEAFRFLKGSIWGLPYEILDTALLWIHGGQEASYRLRFPSWSWMSASTDVRFLHLCEEFVVCKVTWHKPLLIGRDATPPICLESIEVDFNGISGKCTDQQAASLFSALRQEKVVLHYGLLQFTAQAAQLDIKWADVNDSDNMDHWVDANACDISGGIIGTLRVPSSFFNSAKTWPSETILLSANAEDIEDEICKRLKPLDGEWGNVVHVDGCKHVKDYNIMLIEWRGDIAYRAGLGKATQAAWDKLETRDKRIILG
ncbi:heterokaryon incompatibility protein-domain-containing protein [Hypoxylon sp. NC1633]|nr:heterokaryon incompatibility protein-domain-containing protein [Hypoxylon sp. NC1633]